MVRLRGSAWLWAGALAGVLVAASGLEGEVTAALGRLLPLPWSRLGIGLLVFWAGAGLHFRHHWAACLQAAEACRRRQAAAGRLLGEVIADGCRWLGAIRENLEMVADGGQRPQEVELYLAGARAHATKLEETLARLEGIRRGLPGAG